MPYFIACRSVPDTGKWHELKSENAKTTCGKDVGECRKTGTQLDGSTWLPQVSDCCRQCFSTTKSFIELVTKASAKILDDMGVPPEAVGPRHAKMFLLYDGRARAGDTDDASVLDTAHSEVEIKAWRKSHKEMYGDDVVWAEYDDDKGTLINEKIRYDL